MSQESHQTLRNSYSDEDLAEFKPIVQAKLDEARADLATLRDTLTDDADEPTLEEQSSGALTKEEKKQLMARQQKFISHLEAALVRIANKTYGICRVSGALISKERLRLVPHATLAIHINRPGDLLGKNKGATS